MTPSRTYHKPAPVDPDSIVPCSGFGAFVPSASHPGCYYRVEYDDTQRTLTCSCPAGERAAIIGTEATACRHMRGWTERVRQDDARHRRPVVPPAISALVD